MSTEQENRASYLQAEWDLQMPKFEKLGIDTKNQFPEQAVNAVLALAESLEKRLYRALDALGSMYQQYSPGRFGHDFMSAGEEAQDVLGMENLLDTDYNFTGMPPNLYDPARDN